MTRISDHCLKETEGDNKVKSEKPIEGKRADEITEYIKKERSFAIPDIQERFGLPYYTVREIVRGLENDDKVRFVSGICYEYVGDEAYGEEHSDICSDNNGDAEGNERRKRTVADVLEDLRNLGNYLDTEEYKKVVRTAAGRMSESDTQAVSPFRYSRPDDPKEDYSVCTYEETLAGRQNAGENEDGGEDKDNQGKDNQDNEEYVIDDPDDSEYAGWNVLKRYGYEFTEMVLEYMGKMPDFDPETNTFRTRLNIRFPDGSPLYIGYVINNDNQKYYFTDTGCTWKYFSGCYPNVETYELEKYFYRIAGKLGFDTKYFFVKDRILYSNLALVEEANEFTNEIAFVIQRIEDILAEFDPAELPGGVKAQFSLEDKINRFVEDDANYAVDSDFDNEYTLSAATVELLQRIAAVDKSITREKALETALAMYRRTDEEYMSFEVRMLLRNIIKALEECDDSQFEAICKIRIPRQ